MFVRFFQFFEIGPKKLNQPSDFKASHHAGREDQDSGKNFPRYCVHIKSVIAYPLPTCEDGGRGADLKSQTGLALDMLAETNENG